MAFKVLVYSFAFKRHCNVWLLETFAILVKAYQPNVQCASIIRQLFKLCFHMTDFISSHKAIYVLFWNSKSTQALYTSTDIVELVRTYITTRYVSIYLSLAGTFNK